MEDLQVPPIHPPFKSTLTLDTQLELDKQIYGFCAWKVVDERIERVNPASLERGAHHSAIWIDEAEMPSE